MTVHWNRAFGAVPVALIAGLSLVLTACGSGSASSVVVSPARTQALSLSPGGFGVVEAGVDRAIVFSRHGLVLSVNVRNGQTVTAGEVVGTVSTIGASPEAARLSNLLQGDQKLLTLQKATLGDNNSQTLATLQRIADERKQLADAQGAADLVAPIPGVVAGLNVAPGASIDGGDILMHVVDARSTVVVAPIALQYRAYLVSGTKVEVSVPDSPNPPLAGTLVNVNQTLNEAGTGIETTFQLASNASKPALGARAYVKLPLATKPTVVVNALAISRTSQSPYVFVVKDGRVKLQVVSIGVSDGTWTQVLSGLNVGDDVVVAGTQDLDDGTKVRISQRQS